MGIVWKDALSAQPLCSAREGCDDQYMVNWTAICDDASRIVAGTYYHPYEGTTRNLVDGKFGLYCYDTAGAGTRLFADEYPGDEGIYAVAISGDGTIAAGGGLLRTTFPVTGLLRAYDVASHRKLLDKSDIPARVNCISLSADGSVLAAVAEKIVYVFQRGANGSYAAAAEVALGGYSETVALHPSGQWLAAADQKGKVYLICINKNGLQPALTWTALEPQNPLIPDSLAEPVKLRCVSVARAGTAFVACGGDFIYLLTLASMQAASPGPVARFSTFDRNTGGHHNVRFVAVSDDASFVTAVVNDFDRTGLRPGETLLNNEKWSRGRGRLLKISTSGGALTKEWEQHLGHWPNTTSIDSSGTRITAADGYPDKIPGTFYLFDNTGATLWEAHTNKMCWPMFISANGAGIAGGNDDNTLFFLKP